MLLLIGGPEPRRAPVLRACPCEGPQCLGSVLPCSHVWVATPSRPLLKNTARCGIGATHNAGGELPRIMVRRSSAAEHPTPPGPPVRALLSSSRSGVGLCPIRRLLD